jgi:hypothetical protein
MACGRTIYEQGRARIIEAARVLAGDQPVEELLVRLEASKKARDLQRLADVAILLEEYAREGHLRRLVNLIIFGRNCGRSSRVMSD